VIDTATAKTIANYLMGNMVLRHTPVVKKNVSPVSGKSLRWLQFRGQPART